MARADRKSRLRFGNWIRARILLTHLAVGTGLVATGLLFSDPLVRGLIWAAAAVPLGIGVFLTYLFTAFAESGGGMQRRLWTLVLDRTAWNGQGEALDVGTGQGALAVGLAMRFPTARVVGMDLWAADWAYSMAACEANARAAGVADRVRFERASAATLPVADGSMDLVVSHFVFHEVKDGGGPLGALKEAVRVLRPGGFLCVQDMFLDRRLYGDVQTLLRTLEDWGLKDVRFSRLADLIRIPWGMGGRRVLGAAGLITAVKRAD